MCILLAQEGTVLTVSWMNASLAWVGSRRRAHGVDFLVCAACSVRQSLACSVRLRRVTRCLNQQAGFVGLFGVSFVLSLLPAAKTVTVSGGAGFWQYNCFKLFCGVDRLCCWRLLWQAAEAAGSSQRGVEAGLCFAGPCHFGHHFCASRTACVYSGVGL